MKGGVSRFRPRFWQRTKCTFEKCTFAPSLQQHCVTVIASNYLRNIKKRAYSLPLTGRIWFRRARFQTPNSVSFSGLTEFQGGELSELFSAHYLCAKANSPSFSRNSPSLPQNSVSSLFRNSTLETVVRPFLTQDNPQKIFSGHIAATGAWEATCGQHAIITQCLALAAAPAAATSFPCRQARGAAAHGPSQKRDLENAAALRFSFRAPKLCSVSSKRC